MRSRRAPVLGREAHRGPSLSCGASLERSATGPRAMATRRGWPRVVFGPALGWLLLLLSSLAPGRASPRLLDFPASVCEQEVREAGRAERGCRGRRGWWGGRRRVVKRCQRGGRREGRRDCEGPSKVPRAVASAKGRTAQAPAGLGRMKVRPRNSEEVPGMGAAWRRAGNDSASGVAVRGSSRETTRAAESLVARRGDNSVRASKLEDEGTRGWQLGMDRDLEKGPWQELNRSGLAPNSLLPEQSSSSFPMLRRPSLAPGVPTGWVVRASPVPRGI